MNIKKRSINIPLFWKFAIASTIIVVIFGSINIFLLWSSVYKSFEKEIDKRCKVLATIISEKVLTPMVYEDNLNLYNILNGIKESDPSISYAFILNNKNNIVAQTYDFNIPNGLVEINTLVKGHYNIKVIETDHFQHSVIRDIAYPILNGEIGTVRLGIVEEHIRQEIYEATKTLVLMIIAFLVFGLFGAFVFSYIITKPIKEISKKAQILDLNYIASDNFNIKHRKKLQLYNVKIDDELDILVEKFSDMLIRLKTSYIELRETQGALIQAEKLASIGTLSAGVAHEINNPISGIMNCLNRMIKNPNNIEQNANYTQLIKDAINKIENVVQHLLNFSRKHDIALEKTDLNSVIDSAIKLTLFKIESNQVKINVDNSTNNFVKGSANHLAQVLVNLILNSIDAIVERKEKEPSLKGEIQISITKNKNITQLHLRDNGTGIRSEMENRIFDPFFTSKNVGKGTGLGLSVSFNLIKEHNGQIYFKSTPNLGTEFIIDLPSYTKQLNS